MKKSKRQILSLLMAAAMAAGLLSGCGGGAEGTTPAAGCAVTKGASRGGRAATKEPRQGGAEASGDYSDVVITYGMTSTWDTVNPYGSSSGSIYQQLVADKIYDRLAFLEEAGSDVTPRGAAS